MALFDKKIMVYVSAIAVIAAPRFTAMAAPTVNCTRNISFGRIIPLCNGSITVRGTSASNTINNGCHSLVVGAIQPAICSVQTTLGVATQDVRVTFTSPQRQFAGSGGGQVTLDNYRIQTASGSAVNSYTFSAALLDPKHTFKVGGRLRFGSNEASGSYSSNISIVVTSIP